MGTSFKAGKVCGDHLVCPLHLREYAVSGACKKIPGITQIPNNAHQSALKVKEFAGIIFVFLGSQPSFDFPMFSKATQEDIAFSQPATYVLNTPYQALIFNGFDTHHLGCIHSREILTDPIFQSQKHLMTAEYSMGVLVNNWYDFLVKHISSEKNDIFLECFGGNFLIISNKTIKDNILICSVPITYSQSRIFLTTIGNKESHFLKSLFQPFRQWLTTFLGVSFLKPDIKIIENMRPDLRNFHSVQDKGAALFWEYWDQLERDKHFQDQIRL
jgi:phenylpropionate dioxygenase-like ring-hydroxylating dioxygenase large terminal subunit